MIFENEIYNCEKKLKKVCCFGIILKLMSMPVSLITARMISGITEKAVDGDVTSMLWEAFFIFALTATFLVFRAWGEIWFYRMKEKVLYQCRMSFLKIFLENPRDKLFKAEHGELTENLNDDIQALTGRYTELYPCVVSGVLVTFGYMLFLVYKSPVVAVTILILSLLQIVPPAIVKKYMQVNYDNCRKIEAKITEYMAEGICNFETIKLFGVKRWWLKGLADYHKEYLHIGRRADTIAAAQNSMYRLLDNILKFGLYAILGTYVLLKLCSLDIAIEAIYISGSFFSVMKQIFAVVPKFAMSESAQNRLEKWRLKKASHIDAENVISETGYIRLHQVDYCCGEKKILNKVDFEFDCNQKYLIKGANGAGKTTLLNLLTGLILPDNGEVMAYYRDIFYVLQDDPKYGFDAFTLFHMFGEECKERIYLIAERFGLTKERMKGHKISELSGGERKKVFLSIGFAVRTKWLFLDEPSNHLDQCGIEALLQMIKERTGIIVLSHDLLCYGVEAQILKLQGGSLYYEKNEREKAGKKRDEPGVSGMCRRNACAVVADCNGGNSKWYS